MKKDSLTRRLFLTYTAVIISVMSIFTVILVSGYFHIWHSNLLRSNSLTLRAIEDKFAIQCESVKTTLKCMAAFKAEDNMTILSNISNFLSTPANISEAYISEKQLISSYIKFIQQPLNQDTVFSFIISRDKSNTDLFIQNGINSSRLKQYMKHYKTYLDSLSPDNINAKSINFISPDYDSSRYFPDYYVIYDYIRLENSPGAYSGYLICAYPIDAITRLIRNYIGEPYGTTCIISNDGQTIFSTDTAGYNLPFPYLELIRDKETFSFEHNGFIISSVTNDRFGFHVINVTPKSEMYKNITFEILLVVLLSLTFLIAATIMNNHFTRRILGRIQVITGTMNMNGNGNLGQHIPLGPYNDELNLISSTYNEMLDKLKIFIDEKYVQELNLKEIALSQKRNELYALQSQINPHFLYNSLELLRMTALEDDSARTAAGIRTLAEIFRRRLTQTQVVTIGEELEHCKSLLTLYALRFEGELEVLTCIDPPVLSYMIPKDLLQPVIENIIVHAFPAECLNDDKKIVIAAQLQDPFIHITLTDNGIGINDEQLEQIRRRLRTSGPNPPDGHIGIENVHRRIQLLYGMECGISLESSTAGCTVTLHIKALTKLPLAEDGF